MKINFNVNNSKLFKMDFLFLIFIIFTLITLSNTQSFNVGDTNQESTTIPLNTTNSITCYAIFLNQSATINSISLFTDSSTPSNQNYTFSIYDAFSGPNNLQGYSNCNTLSPGNWNTYTIKNPCLLSIGTYYLCISGTGLKINIRENNAATLTYFWRQSSSSCTLPPTFVTQSQSPAYFPALYATFTAPIQPTTPSTTTTASSTTTSSSTTIIPSTTFAPSSSTSPTSELFTSTSTTPTSTLSKSKSTTIKNLKISSSNSNATTIIIAVILSIVGVCAFFGITILIIFLINKKINKNRNNQIEIAVDSNDKTNNQIQYQSHPNIEDNQYKKAEYANSPSMNHVPSEYANSNSNSIGSEYANAKN